MYKILKTIAPVILSIFFCTSVIAPAWGVQPEKQAETQVDKQDKVDKVEVTMTLYTYDPASIKPIEQIDKPYTGQIFMVDLKVQGKGSQITSVELFQSAFTYIDSYDEQDSSPWVHRKAFILKAPGEGGVFPCTFECTDKLGNKVFISADIEVVKVFTPPVTVPATKEVIVPVSPVVTKEVIVPVVPIVTKEGTTYRAILPMYKPIVISTDNRISTPGMTFIKVRPVHSATRIQMSCNWGLFVWGFIIGVVVTAVIYASGTPRATK